MSKLDIALAAELIAMAKGSDTNVESVNVHFVDRVLRRIPEAERPREVVEALLLAKKRFVPALVSAEER